MVVLRLPIVHFFKHMHNKLFIAIGLLWVWSQRSFRAIGIFKDHVWLWLWIGLVYIKLKKRVLLFNIFKQVERKVSKVVHYIIKLWPESRYRLEFQLSSHQFESILDDVAVRIACSLMVLPVRPNVPSYAFLKTI